MDPRGDTRNACLPSQSNFFHFHAVFGENLAKIIGWYPFGVGAPHLGNLGSTTENKWNDDLLSSLKCKFPLRRQGRMAVTATGSGCCLNQAFLVIICTGGRPGKVSVGINSNSQDSLYGGGG